MNRWLHFLDNFTAGYIFISTPFVWLSVSITQSQDMPLSGENLWVFLFGFIGSLICTIIRFCLSYMSMKKQPENWKKILGLIYCSIGVVIAITYLWLTLYMAKYSLDYRYLFAYNKYQTFMLMSMFGLYFGVRLLGTKLE